ncbi:MAG: GNAT family N-acetyltransferase [Chloroflexi bacterium]|nr:GNAT family N-acetyltransferase [Chloroflexota bacterium]
MSVFQIREANPNDVEGMARVRVDTWRTAYQGIVPADFLEGLSYQRVSEHWRKTFWEDRTPGVAVFVAEEEQGDIVGIAICGPEQSQDPLYHGEIYVLYVLPRCQNQGIGRELVAACVRHLVQQLKVDSLLVWVIAENPYRRFYEALGGKVVREKVKEIGGRQIAEAGYGWKKLHDLAHLASSDKRVSPC